MRKLRRATLAVDLMESRALLSGTAHAMSTTSDASEVLNIARQPVSVAADAKFTTLDTAAKADLATIKTEETQLESDLKTLTPYLKTDEAADEAAIKEDSKLQTAQETLKDKLKPTAAALKAALAAINAATTSTAREDAIKLYDTNVKTFDWYRKIGVAAIKNDRDQFESDLKTLRPHLKTDEAADIKADINHDSTVQTAEAALKAEQKTDTSTVKLAFSAIQKAPTTSARNIAIQRYQTDVSTLGEAIKTDQEAVQTAINNDSGVAAVQVQFMKCDASITADQTTLAADYTQLADDLKAEYVSGSSGSDIELGLFGLDRGQVGLGRRVERRELHIRGH